MPKKKDKFLGDHDKAHYKRDRPCFDHRPSKKEQFLKLIEDLMNMKVGKEKKNEN